MDILFLYILHVSLLLTNGIIIYFGDIQYLFHVILLVQNNFINEEHYENKNKNPFEIYFQE